MNYIELLNQFWQTRRRVRLSSNEADLYYFLMNESNSRMWENPFECTNILICATIGMSEKTLIDVRNRLVQKGLIFVEAGQKKKKSPVYTLLYCKKESINVSIEGSITDSINVSKNPNIIYKHKQETKTKEKEKAKRFSPPTLDDVFDFFTKEKNLNLSEAKYRSERFFLFYDSKNWMVGKNKMTNWKSAATKSLEWEDKSNKDSSKTEYIVSKKISEDNGKKLMNEFEKRQKLRVTREEAIQMKKAGIVTGKDITPDELESIRKQLRELGFVKGSEL